MSRIRKLGNIITTHSKVILLAFVVLTAGMAFGATMVSDESSLSQFESESDEREAATYIDENFESQGQENTTTVQIIARGDNVLSQDSILQSLRLQQELLNTPEVNQTLAEQRPIVGVETFIGQAAVNQTNVTNATIAGQIAAVEALSDQQYNATLSGVFGNYPSGSVAAFMPSSFEYTPGTGVPTATSRLTSVTQLSEAANAQTGSASEDLIDSQTTIQSLAAEQDQTYVIFGAGILNDEINRSMGDSLAIVAPLALLFVVIALAVAYRDPLDIVLGVVGILGVLIWTFGFMGWADIAFNQMMIAAPVLLIGLSIDYAIHVFMRHREQRLAEDVSDDVRESMAIALAGVGVALLWVTATTAIGFLANLISPISPIGEFGIVTAFGIGAALVIFGAVIPAAKVELDELLERYGIDRKKRAFGTGGGRISQVLSIGATAARRAPLAVLLVTALVTAGGVVGATQVDTSFNQEDFLADSPPEWTEQLPEPFAPGEYQVKENLEYINENYQPEGSQANILIRGDVTSETALAEIAAARDQAADEPTVFVSPGGEPNIQGPLSLMQRAAGTNASFNQSFVNSDPDNDGVPEENITALYDQLFAISATSEEISAGQVLSRTDTGDYQAAQLIVGIKGTASFEDTTEDMRAIADDIEIADTDTIATGDPIISYIVEQDLLNTVLQTLLITLVAVFTFLSVAYKLTGNSATLGIVTLLPIILAVSWILGTMYLLDIPFNVMTGMITSLTIGLGVAYSIHISSRYTLELERQGDLWAAMRTTVTGTGGALLGSAATTVGGFGTLALAILPVLQQFGIITGLTIIYTFLASVLVLPTLLALWTRYFGPTPASSDEETTSPVAGDGGQPQNADN